MAGGGCALVLLGPLFGGEVVGATSVGSSACVYSFLSIFLNSACECERGDIGIHSLRPCSFSPCTTTFTLSGCAAQSGNLLNISKTDKPETIKLERHHAKLRRTCTICQAMALSQRPTIAAG